MSDETITTGKSPQEVAYQLMICVLTTVEGRKLSELDRKSVLDTYAECLTATKGKRKYRKDKSEH